MQRRLCSQRLLRAHIQRGRLSSEPEASVRCADAAICGEFEIGVARCVTQPVRQISRYPLSGRLISSYRTVATTAVEWA
jgi:hypothetical protein